MKKVRVNPLFDPKPEQLATLTAANNRPIPISPFSGRPMTLAFCDETPVYVDLEKKIVVPIRID